MWLLVQGRIKSRSVLHTKIVDNQLCEVCSDADETPQHIISGCPTAAQFWKRLHLPSMLQVTPDSLHTVLPSRGIARDEFSAFIALGCWQLWKTRNARVFRNETTTVQQVLLDCKNATEQWRFRLPRKKKPLQVRGAKYSK